MCKIVHCPSVLDVLEHGSIEKPKANKSHASEITVSEATELVVNNIQPRRGGASM